MYDRTIGDKVLTLQVSGMLWNRSLVMRDLETGSLWSHLLGECKRGPLQGEVLETISGRMMTWGAWKEKYPETTVLNLSRTARGFTRKMYDQQLDRLVYGIRVDGAVKAYPLSVLAKTNVLQDEWAGNKLIVVYDEAEAQVSAYLRDQGGETRSFKPALHQGRLVDHSGTLWDARSGEEVGGEGRLKPLLGIVSFRKAWRVFHPDSAWAE